MWGERAVSKFVPTAFQEIWNFTIETIHAGTNALKKY